MSCLIPFANTLFAGLSGLSSLLFMVGAIGYTNKASVIKDIAWINVDYYGTKYYYSLFAASFPFADEVDSFKGCADYSNTCDHCNDDGHSAYIMTIIACLSAISCATMSIALIKHSDFWLMQYAVVAGAASSFLMSGVALCVFMADCQHRLQDDDPNSGAKYTWGPGSIVVAVGMVMMFTVMLGTIILVKCAAIDAADDNAKPNNTLLVRM